MCAGWTAPHEPVRLFGNTWYVGMATLSSVLITSPQGHVLLDGGLPVNATQILANIRTAGFDPRDVKVIVNSHAHYDHAGGIAELQRATGARVLALAWSAAVMRRGITQPDDPQATIHFGYPAVRRVSVIADGDTVRVGPLQLVAHRTAGHTPGGTTWTWQSCDGPRCVHVVYADSQTPVSSDEFRYTGTQAVRDFAAGQARLEALRCDLLITPHPEAMALWDRVAKRDAGDARALLDPTACQRYAANGRAALDVRLTKERAAR
jgi:metallo-beta-lactamase class B